MSCDNKTKHCKKKSATQGATLPLGEDAAKAKKIADEIIKEILESEKRCREDPVYKREQDLIMAKRNGVRIDINDQDWEKFDRVYKDLNINTQVSVGKPVVNRTLLQTPYNIEGTIQCYRMIIPDPASTWNNISRDPILLVGVSFPLPLYDNVNECEWLPDEDDDEEEIIFYYHPDELTVINKSSPHNQAKYSNGMPIVDGDIPTVINQENGKQFILTFAEPPTLSSQQNEHYKFNEMDSFFSIDWEIEKNNFPSQVIEKKFGKNDNRKYIYLDKQFLDDPSNERFLNEWKAMRVAIE